MRGRQRAGGWTGSSTSVTTRFAAAVVGVSLVSLVITLLVGLTAGRDLSRSLFEDRLVAMRASAAFDTASHIKSLKRTAESLAASPNTTAALDAFAAGHSDLLRHTQLDVDERDALITHYQTEYVGPLREAGREVNLRDVAVENQAGAYIQFHYAVDVGEFGVPEAVVDPRDGSAWTETHIKYHPVYRDVVSRADLVDLLLVEPRAGHVVYSVRKRPELGSSLSTGPFSGSAISSVTSQVREDPSGGTRVSDLTFYDPALTTPVGVIAVPVTDGDRVAGVLVLMYDSSALTGLLTAGGEWDAARFPPTGETFLVGADGTTRTEPRSYVENPRAHLDAAQAAGLLTDDERAFIEAAGTTVLTQHVTEATAEAGPEGRDDVEQRTTIDGRDAFSTVTSIGDDDLKWWAVAELGVDAAEGDLRDFQELLVVGSAILVVILAFLAVGWANGIVRPVREMSDRLSTERRGEVEPLELPPRSPIEFQELAGSLASMSEALRHRQEMLVETRDSRLLLLHRILPHHVADRVIEGDLGSVEQVADASAVAVVVIGAGAVGSDSGLEPELGVVARLHDELDDLAEYHGLERVKVVGDTYFAACGHDRLYLDHATRALAFAADANDVAAELSADSAELTLAIGLDAGVMAVGTTGGRHLVYDVWGPAVARAHRLARRAGPGRILYSDATRRRLPDTVESVEESHADRDEPIWRFGGTRAGERL